MLNNTFRCKGLVRAAFLLPWIIPVLSTLAWLWMFDATFSVINWCLRSLGWCSGASTGWGTRAGYGLDYCGERLAGILFFAISLLAGLQTISDEALRSGRH